MGRAPEPADLVDLLRLRAERQGGARAFLFLADGERESMELSYGELDRRARAVAGRLRELGLEGERALLLYPPGLELLVGFFGCLYAGVRAVPVQAPQGPRKLAKVDAVSEDCRPAVVLSQASARRRLERFLAASRAAGLPCLATDEIPAAAGGREEAGRPAGGASAVAYLQYTSGSTAAPKGVRVSHANLLDNLGEFDFPFDPDGDPGRRMVTWLPAYHDMGLIYGLLGPIYGGFPCVVMAPAAFLQKPARWLRAISTYRATHSASPNFGLDLCARRVSPEEARDLDLSCWSVARLGAEPIRAETLERFHRAFAPGGFRRSALSPGYGLAEATLKVTFVREDAPPSWLSVEARGLREDRVRIVEAESDGARTLVSCGATSGATAVAIVDPAIHRGLADGEIGEIWVSGPSVAEGYFERSEATRDTFRAERCDAGRGSYLRTGDLGFLWDGELYVSGRLKDLIILRGENHYPQDLEATVEASHPVIRGGHVAAFPIEVAGEECLALVAELRRTRRRDDPDEVIAAVLQALAEEHGVRPRTVVLTRPAVLPKTSSGKLQRRRARARFEAEEIPALARFDAAAADLEPPGAPPGEPMSAGDILDLLLAGLARRLGVPAASLDADLPPARYGLDSLDAQCLTGELAGRLGRTLPATLLFDHPSIAAVAGELARGIRRSPAEPGAAPGGPEPVSRGGGEAPLSFAQERIWFMEHLEPGMNVLSLALSLDGALDDGALRRAVGGILHRHEILRTRFRAVDGRPVQIPRTDLREILPVLDLAALSEASRPAAWRLFWEASPPGAAAPLQRLDLAAGRPLRAVLVKLDERRRVLLVSVHHIVLDGGSWHLFLGELARFYRRFAGETSAAPPPGLRPAPDPEGPALQYADVAAWQRQRLRGDVLEAELDFWRKHLAGAPPALDLPFDRPRGSRWSSRGEHHAFRLPGRLAEELKAFSRREDVTVFTALLAVFDLLLGRVARQNDVVVGVNVAVRPPATADLLGCFVNTLALRADLSGEPTFRELLARVRRTVLEGLSHREAPYDKVVEAVQPQRRPGRTPLFQVVFDYGQPRLSKQIRDTLAAAGIEISILEQDDRVRWDLQLFMSEDAGRFSGVWSYATDLFDAATIERFHRRFATLLKSALTRPEAPASELEMESEADKSRLAGERAARRASKAARFLKIRPKTVEI